MKEGATKTGDGAPAGTAAAKARAEPRAATPAAVLGNQRLQGLYRAGQIRLAPEVGAPDDPQEREADRIAAAVAAGKPACCATCAGPSDPRRRRTPEGRGAAAGNDAGAANAEDDYGPGRALAAAQRRELETALGADLGGVRVHDNQRAAAAARALRARAFTQGRDIVFGEGRYRPDTDAGRRLITHEVAHVLQRRGSPDGPLRRADGDGDGDGAATGDFDPCAVAVTTLTNTALVAHLVRVRAAIGGRQRGAGERYYDWANLDRRLAAERKRRIDQGHLWLGEQDIAAVPSPLYRLSEWLGVIEVLPAPAGAADENPPQGGRLITAGQFNAFLEREDIPRVDLSDYFAGQDPEHPQPYSVNTPRRPGAGLAEPGRPWLWPQFGSQAAMGGLQGIGPWITEASPFDRRIQPWWSRTPNSPIEWRGHWPEQSYLLSRPGAMDLNAVSPNFRVVDVRDPGLAHPLVSITHTMPEPGATDPDWGSIREKFRKMSGDLEPDKFARMVADLNAATGGNLSLEQARAQTMLAIPEDLLAGARADLATQIAANRRLPTGDAGLVAAADAWLATHPYTMPNGQRAISIAQLEAAQALGARGGGISRTAFDTAITAIGSGAKLKRELRSTDLDWARWSREVDSWLAQHPVALPNGQQVTRVAQLEAARDLGARGGGISSARFEQMIDQIAAGSGVQNRGWTRAIDTWLAANPITLPNGQVVRNYAALQAQRRLGPSGGGISDLRFSQAMELVGQSVATSRTAGIPLLTGELASSLALRQRFMALPETDIRRLALPETIELYREGGRRSGGLPEAQGVLAHRSGVRGAKVGAAGSFLLTTGGALLDPEHARWQDLVLSAPVGAGEGYVTGVVDQRLTVWTNERLMAYAAQRAAAGETTALLSRTGGVLSRVPGGLAGGPISAGFTLGSMAIDDLLLGGHYTDIDYAARGSRAFVSGTAAGAGGALAAGITGAVLGSEVPVLGNAIGFLVGVGIYYLVDSTVGEAVESKVRVDMGEEGCVARPPASAQPLTVPMFDTCFLPGTLIRLGDGTERPIETLAPGLVLLGYDEVAHSLGPARLDRVHRGAAQGHVDLSLANGRLLRVTPGHRFLCDRDWVNAGLLRVGDACTCASADGSLAPVRITAIHRRTDTTPVYNLEVTPQRTYVAEGAVVHNVKP